jgi:hypothetical protein
LSPFFVRTQKQFFCNTIGVAAGEETRQANAGRRVREYLVKVHPPKLLVVLVLVLARERRERSLLLHLLFFLLLLVLGA